MNGITFKRGAGGLGRLFPGEDHISGIIAGPEEQALANKTYELRTIEQAEAEGITPQAAPILHYHISEFFRLSQGGLLFVCIAAGELDGSFVEIKNLQAFAGGRLRRVGILLPDVSVTALVAMAGTANDVCLALAADNMPLTAILVGKLTTVNLAALPNLHEYNFTRAGICIAQDGAGYGAYLQGLVSNTDISIGALGALLGTMAKRRVSDSIGWVEKYNVVSGAYPKTLTGSTQQALELDVPALADGTKIADITPAQQEAINEKGYIFLRKYVGYSGTYWNDAFTLTALTSDYAYLENTETMDKACRGVYQALLPQVSGPAYVDATTGNLAESTCKAMEALAEAPLEQMQRDGELSGFQVSIDATQNVLATSKLQVTVKLVPVGVMREIVVTIGFALKIE
jgi:hypothetical protein